MVNGCFMQTKLIPVEQATLPERFLTAEEFLERYDRGTPVDLDLDPRIDLTRPIYEQAAALTRQDEEAAQVVKRPQADAS